jgi:phenolic acid decarboxylase
MLDSVIEIDIHVEEEKLFFRRFFCAFGPCLEGFSEGYIPYLSVDSTALIGRWNGYLPSATSVDGLNWMFSVAFGFFEAESRESWTWFLQQLQKAIGEPLVLAVHSDAYKGLTAAVLDVFPHAEQRECFRHLMQNYIKNFVGKEFMYPAAQTYRSEVYAHHMTNVASIPSVIPWMKEHHKLTWYRSGFNQAIKCDYITNNIAEVFNNWIKDYKDLPVCELVDKIRVMLMELFFRRRRIGENLNTKILPSVTNLLNAKTRGLGQLSLAKGDHYCAEVQVNNNVLTKHIVKVEEIFCSCLEWQHIDKPCQHALILITA